MKTYYSNEEVQKDIVNEVLEINDDIEIAFDGFFIKANIKCKKIISKDYKRNINAWNINAWNINAWNINAWNINAGNINAGDINTGNINAGNINAGNINAGNINAGNINYFAVCFSLFSFKCKLVSGRRTKSRHFCLDKEIEIK